MRRAPPLLSDRLETPAALAVAALLTGVVAAILVALAAALALAQPILDQRLAGSMTVVVSGRMDSGALESSDAAAARAREVLAGLPGVSHVRVMEPAAIDRLLARVLKAPAASGDTGPPRFIALGLAPGGPAVAAATAARALRGEGLLFAIDDHGLWSGPCERLEFLVAAAIAIGLLACVAALGAIAAGAAGRGIDGAWPRLEILSHLGVDPSRLAGAATGPMVGRSAAMAAAGVMVGLCLCWLRWPAAAPIAPPMLVLAGGAAAWLLSAALVARGLARRVARRRLQALFA